MKRKHLFLAIGVLLALAAFWLGRSGSRTDASHHSSAAAVSEARQRPTEAGEGPDSPRLAPPNPTRRFTEFTPEQRVEFARKGHGPGG